MDHRIRGSRLDADHPNTGVLIPRRSTGMSYYSPCGGGYGSPLERDPQKVLDDVLDGTSLTDDTPCGTQKVQDRRADHSAWRRPLSGSDRWQYEGIRVSHVAAALTM